MQNERMTPEQIREQLAQCSGTESHYHHFSGLLYTDGIKLMAELCGAYWLIDVIASLQLRCRRDPMLRDMQFWFLRKVEDGWELVCERDEGDIAFKQRIDFSDFPLNEIQIWVQDDVMLLPSEY